MIGLILIPAFIGWLVISVVISSKIPDWLRIKKHTTAITVLLIPVVLLAPIADEIIGRAQFHYLCKKEAVVWLSPDWKQVNFATVNDDPIAEMHGYIIPIRVQRIEFINSETKEPFLSYKGFHTKGGFLMRNSLGLNFTTSCWPKDSTQILKELNIDQLLKHGK